MNIKEIIDSERWELVGGFDTEVKRHNASLDRIEGAVTERIAEGDPQTSKQPSDGGEFERTISEIRVPWGGGYVGMYDDGEVIISQLTAAHNADRAADKRRIAELELRLGCCRDASAGKDLLIAELEAQVPKVVTPVFNIGNFDCPECEYRTLPEPCLYCPGCGAKLDWSSND